MLMCNSNKKSQYLSSDLSQFLTEVNQDRSGRVFHHKSSNRTSDSNNVTRVTQLLSRGSHDDEQCFLISHYEGNKSSIVFPIKKRTY